MINDLEKKLANIFDIQGELITLSKRLFFRKNYLCKSEGDKNYLIKTYPLSKKDALVTLSRFFELSNVQNIQYQRGVINKFGTHFFVDKGTIFAVYEYYDGRVVDIKKDNFKHVGEYLNRFHKEFVVDKQVELDLQLNDSRNIIQFCYKKLKKYNLSDFFEEADELTNKQAIEVLKIWEKLLEKDISIIHGDCTINNLLINDSGFLMIDFDDTRMGNTKEDVANMINSIYFSSKDSIEFYGKTTELIDGYYSYEKVDRDVLNLLCRALALKEICIHLDEYKYLTRNPNTKNYLKKLFNIFKNNRLIEVEENGK